MTQPARTYADLRSEIHKLEDEIGRLHKILAEAPEAVVNPSAEWIETYAEWRNARAIPAADGAKP